MLLHPAKKINSCALFERECGIFFAEMVQLFGVPKSVGQIYGLLYASPTPLGFSDIVSHLEISKGSASQGLQLLRSLGAIVEADVGIRVGEGRGIAYEPELSLRNLVTGVLREQIAPMASAGAGRLKCLRSLAEESGEERKFYVGRVKQLENWRRRFNTVLPVITALLGPKRRVKA